MSATEQQVNHLYQAAAENPADRLNEKPGDDLLQFVICLIGSEEFAVDVLSVQEINRIVEVTRVPKTPPYVEGVINLRGRIIPVLDLRKALRTCRRSTDHTDAYCGGIGAGAPGRVDRGLGRRSPSRPSQRHRSRRPRSARWRERNSHKAWDALMIDCSSWWI